MREGAAAINPRRLLGSRGDGWDQLRGGCRLPTWHVVEQQAFGIAKSGPYVLLGWETGTAQLIDGQTGKRVVLRPRAGCSFDDGYSTPLGGSWVVTMCQSGSFELYSIPSRRWIPFSPDFEQMFALSGICANRYPPLCGAQYVTIGDQWIEFDVSYGYHSGPTVPTYERIKSGQITTNPPGVKPGGNQILDLDSPNLTRTLCDPLRMPVPFGTIVTDGGFAIDEESAPPEYVQHTYLERCGSSLHEPIGTDASWVHRRRAGRCMECRWLLERTRRIVACRAAGG